MADGLRALRWRAAVLLVGLGLVFAWIRMSGGTGHTIQIDWSWARMELEGAEVEINDSIVGTLQPYGRSTFVTGFNVEPGEYVVRVLYEDCLPVPDTVRLGGPDGRLAVFIADLEDGYTCRVVLRGR